MTTPAYYNFISYIREGFSNTITEKDILGIPDSGGTPLVQFTARVFLNGDTSTPKHNLPIMLAGPGEIIGINEKVIIKKAPIPGDTNFSPTFVPFIEFYSPDFPWRYTHAAPADEDANHEKRLRPWLTLVTLEEEEYTLLDSVAEGLPARFKLNNTDNLDKVLPSEKEIWAWAHIQVNDDITNTGHDTVNQAVINTYTDLIQNSPEKVISRIISPRKLKLNKNYRTFLVPTFKRGLQAAVGEDVVANKQEPAWYHDPENPQDNPDSFPYYYSWSFNTGAYGDFESLARKITPSVPSPDMGKMKMDITRPNHLWLDGIAVAQQDWDGHLDMEGVLKQPLPLTPELPEEIETVYTNLVNLGDDYQNTASGTITDPTLTIPFYGQWYAGVSRLDASNNRPWLNLMNKDPRFRLMVGAGQEVMRNNHQSYLDKAWKQAGGKAGGGASAGAGGGGIGSGSAFRSGGGLQQSNKTLRKLQTAYVIADRFFKKHTQQLPDDEFLSLFGRVLTRIKHSCGCTGTYAPPYTYIPNPLPPIVPKVDFQAPSFTPTIAGNTASVDWQVVQDVPSGPYLLQVQQTYAGQTTAFSIPMPGTPTHTFTLTYTVPSQTDIVSLQILPSSPYLRGDLNIATAEIQGNGEGGGGETPTVEFSSSTFTPASSGPTAVVDWVFTQDNPSSPYTLNIQQVYMGQTTVFSINMPGSTPFTYSLTYNAGSQPEIATLMIQSGSDYNTGSTNIATAVIPPYSVSSFSGGGGGFSLMENEKSIKACIKCSSVSVKMVDPAFRSLTRRGSTISRVMGFHKNNPHNIITQVGNQTVKVEPPYTYPGNQLSVGYGIVMTYPVSDTDFVLTYMEYSAGNYDWNAYQYDPNSNFRITAKVMNDMLNAVNETISLYDTEFTPDPLDVIDLTITAKDALQPYKNLKALADARIKVNNGEIPISESVNDFEFNPVKTAPVFDMPMIKPLVEFYDEFFCPNISEIADNSMTLMEVNRPFIEAYMVGINHELNRRLLWDEYPTDQRTTFFKTFFDSSMYPPKPGQQVNEGDYDNFRDITAIDTWDNSQLGNHCPREEDASIVLVLRAELLRKFPNLYLYAQEAEWKTVGGKTYRVLKEGALPEKPIFFADAKPDVSMFGFALTREEIEGSADPEDENPGYFFVFQERGGEVRFGFSIPTDESEFNDEPANWEDLNWGHIAGSLEAIDEMTYIPIENLLQDNNIPNSLNVDDGDSSNPPVYWGSNAADMAYILYDKPVKLSFHASTMLANV